LLLTLDYGPWQLKHEMFEIKEYVKCAVIEVWDTTSLCVPHWDV